MKRIAFLLLLPFLPASAATAQAPDTLIVVYGTVTDYVKRQPLPHVTVRAQDPNNAKHAIEVRTNAEGRYELVITEERSYRVVASAKGHYPKAVMVHATGPTAQEWVGGFGMHIDLVLLPQVKGMDLSFGGEPFGVARFDKAAGNFVWDVDHTRALKDRIQPQMEAYRARMGMPPQEAPR